ncbi:MAG TPA: DinB family protein [Silvibacterium sp.]|nr:DinB family protein [Silvibacterium sp.]
MLTTQSAAAIAESLVAEFETQAPITRRFLERLPEDKLGWKPHPKSMTAGQLAYHLAMIPGGLVRFVLNNPAQTPGFNFPQPESHREILEKFDESVEIVRETLPQFDDAAMNETWRLMAGEKEVLAEPRAQFLRDIMLNHWYQHRGQFCVYLRLLDVPVPASWGPSADEPPPFIANVQQA